MRDEGGHGRLSARLEHLSSKKIKRHMRNGSIIGKAQGLTSTKDARFTSLVVEPEREKVYRLKSLGNGIK